MAFRLRKAAPAAAAAALVLAAAASAGTVVRLTEAANGTTARVHVGDSVVLTLPANASTGYSWRLTSRASAVLRLLSARYVPPKATNPPLLGAPGTYVARFAVVRAGRGSLALAYARTTRPPTPPAKRFSVRIVAS